MAKIYYEKDAPIKALRGKKVAVIGYGSQGHAHSLNLRDSGIEVAVAELKGTDNFKLARKHGFKNVGPEKSEIVCTLKSFHGRWLSRARPAGSAP